MTTPATIAADLLVLAWAHAHRRRAKLAADVAAWRAASAALQAAKRAATPAEDKPDVLPFRRGRDATNHAGPHFPRLGR